MGLGNIKKGQTCYNKKLQRITLAYAKPSNLHGLIKMLTALPIHIWDRELESRIMLAALALINRSDVILGHEYNICPLYEKIENIFHYGAGRPVNILPRTKWYEAIIARNGYVGLAYEEGINNIFSLIAADSYIGIDDRSITALSGQYAWCKKELELMCGSMKDKTLAKRLEDKTLIVGNPRMELCGDLGKEYFSEKTNSLNKVFGDYILISDNFGATTVFGKKTHIEIKYSMNNNTPKDIAELAAKRQEQVIKQMNSSRVKFTELINKIINSFPGILFIFRPHPMADHSVWYKELAKKRNVLILMRDSIEPYIFAAQGLIHAGCTTGIQSELASIATIDLTKMFEDDRTEAASSIIATHRPKNDKELMNSIKEVEKRKKKNIVMESNKTLQVKLEDNVNSMNIDMLNSKLNGRIYYPKSSSLSILEKKLKHHALEIPSMDRQTLWDVIKSEALRFGPNQIKSRTYSLHEISSRLDAAIECIANKNITYRILKPAPNTFYIYRKD